MASTVQDPEERDRRIKLVGEYYTNTEGASIRSTADYFSRNYFEISIATVSAYIKKYMLMNPSDAEKVQSVLDLRTEKTVKDKEVQERIAREVELLFKGLTIEEIANISSEEYWTVYRDIHERLKELNPFIYEKACEILQDRSNENLKQNKR